MGEWGRGCVEGLGEGEKGRGLRLEIDLNNEGVGGRVGGMGLEEGLVHAGLGALRDPGERATCDAAQGRSSEEAIALDGSSVQLGRKRKNEWGARLGGRAQRVRGGSERRCNPRADDGFERS